MYTKIVFTCLLALIAPEMGLNASCKYGKQCKSTQDVLLKTHHQIQQDFLKLQQSVGITTSTKTINMVKKISGEQGAKRQFRKVRSQLNALLSAPTLNIKVIQEDIAYLRHLNPARWPYPEDYELVLQKKMEQGSRATESSI